MLTTTATTAAALKWFVLWTRSHCEQVVFNQLIAKGFTVFLPWINIWSRRAGHRHLLRMPMFPGYVFLHDELNKARYLEVRQARGLVDVLGSAHGPAPVADAEMEAIQAIVRGHVPVMPHPYLREGERVRITKGPLTDVEGVLLRSKPNKGLLVLSVNLLRRSVAIEIDCTMVVPA